MREPVSIHDLDALGREAAAFAGTLRARADRATLVTLSGDLGAGKTAFTQALALAFGVSEHVTSPTFVLAKSYALPEGASFRRLVHIDAYRLAEGKDLAPLAFDELMREPGALVLLEWPEMVADGLPDADVQIRIAVRPDGGRDIAYA
jgi:tRNA threonylcarbamoyladenosine biosynthesis protein TsaE